MSHTTVSVDIDKPTERERLVNQPMTVHSKNRLYTTKRQRERLGIESSVAGRGASVLVKVTDVERDTVWDGGYVQAASFSTKLRYYGAIGLPQSLVEKFDLDVGDNLRVSLETI